VVRLMRAVRGMPRTSELTRARMAETRPLV
jgi:hypothetical protein